MAKKWVLVDIGCLECFEKSKFLGFYNSEEEARKFWDEYSSLDHNWGRPEWAGQHTLLVEEVEMP